MLNHEDYQCEVARTIPVGTYHHHLPGFVMGLAGESGEVADIFKKHLFHGHALDNDKLLLELGDVLWYVTAIGATYGFHLEDIMKANIKKLQKRYPNGFSEQASRERTS